MVSITRNEERKAREKERERESWEGGWKAEFCRNGVREESVLNLIVFAFFPRGKEFPFDFTTTVKNKEKTRGINSI